MRATGIVRKLDDLGRIVIPKEIRKAMKIDAGTPMEIFTHNGAVCFKPYCVIGPREFAQAKKIVNSMYGFDFALADTFGGVQALVGENEFDRGFSICVDGDEVAKLLVKDADCSSRMTTIDTIVKVLEKFFNDEEE